MAVLARAYAITTGATTTVEALPQIARSTWAKTVSIFPSSKHNTPLSDMALSAVVRRMNECSRNGAPLRWRDADGRRAVPHGFRATFRTWVDDTCPEYADAAERALAHEDATR